MLGHFLLTLTEEQEDRVLTRPLQPMFGEQALLTLQDGEFFGCLMCAVTDTFWGAGCVLEPGPHGLALTHDREPGFIYEDLCERFGAPRVNGAIRSRIWSNRARRILQNAPVSRDTEVDAQLVGECR